MGAFGTEGIGYETIGDKAVITTIDHDDFSFMYSGPKFMQKDPLRRVTKITDTTFNSMDYASLTAYWEKCEIRDKEFLASPLTYNVPLYVLYPQYTSKQEGRLEELSDLTAFLVEKVIFGEISYDQALKEYNRNSKKAGLKKFIEQQNQLVKHTQNDK